MRKDNNIFLTICILLLFNLVFCNLVKASEKVNSKILPITSNNYRKDPTALKKAVKKDNISSKTSETISSSEKQNTSKENSISSPKNNNESSKKTVTSPKVVSNSSIKVVQPSKVIQPKKLKEEKTSKKNRVSEPILKVKLTNGMHSSVKIVFPDGGQITDSKGKRISSLKKDGVFAWSTTPTIDKKTKKKKKIEYLDETLLLKPSKDIFSFNGSDYRGKLYLKFTEKGAIAVNELPIEDYLRGVVGREIGANSPDESLKAQSVIARTYAYANKGRHGSDGADVCSTTHCQVYFGKSAERTSVDKAIKDTKGFILSYNGNPISALYHATCGGMTSNNEDVWGGTPEPYLRRVVCNFCINGTKYRWKQELMTDDICKGLAKEGVKLGDIYKVSTEAPSKMDRVSYVVFKTNNGEEKVRGTTIRRIFNLPTTTFVIEDIKENIIAKAKNNKEFDKDIRLESGNVFLSGFSAEQSSPKQLLIYTSAGLKRVQIPSEGWKCISYKSFNKGIALSEKNKDNNSIGNNTKRKNSISTLKESNKRTQKPITKINLFGRGFGHQVGLCQSGAVEMGKIGWNYRQILAHYYKGVVIKNLGY